MKKYIDCIHVNDRTLAYDIMEALERDNGYSVEYREYINDTRRDGNLVYEIKVCRVEHPIPSHIGFSDLNGIPKCEEKSSDDTN